jgi:transcriptional regulator with XRE-family HTH domain
MSEFSQLLSEYIHRKNVRTYSMAEYCGIDRSMMYKIIRGKRTPASLELVDKLSSYLQLTPGESRDLVTAYQITQVGYDNFYRRRDMFDFLNNFTDIANKNNVVTTISTLAQYDRELVSLTNEAEVNQAVLTAVTDQLQRGSGQIQMLIRPDYPFLTQLLFSSHHSDSTLVISHIICLNNTEQVNTAKKDYNLHCLMNILPLCTCGYQYQPYYYYDSISSRLDTFRLFPYLILTDEYAVVLSESLQTGFLTRQHDIRTMLENMFNSYIEQSRPLLTKIENVYDQLQYVQKILCGDSEIEYSFQMTPCMTALLSRDFLDKYVNPQLPSRQAFIEHFENHIHSTYERHIQRNHTLIFSEEGICEFLRTGHLEEYPSYIYTPPAMEDRIALIEVLMKELRNNTYHMRMLKKSIGSVRNGANIYITSYAGYLLFTPLDSGTPIYLNIEETGLLMTFLDFFGSMDESLFYSRDEAIHRLEKLLQDYSSANID